MPRLLSPHPPTRVHMCAAYHLGTCAVDVPASSSTSNRTPNKKTMTLKSSFLELPGELRNEIYRQYADVVTIQVQNGYALSPPLSRTCRMVRKELMSILHYHRFRESPLEMEIFDWDFDPVLTFLQKMKAHHNGEGHVRQLKIFVYVLTPASNYGPQRMKWCVDARFAFQWYNEDLDRQIRLFCHPRLPVRLEILGDYYDVTYVVRFPPSPYFSVLQRGANEDWFANFHDTFRRKGASAQAVNAQLERALTSVSSKDFIAKYWKRYEEWIQWLIWIRQLDWNWKPQFVNWM